MTSMAPNPINSQGLESRFLPGDPAALLFPERRAAAPQEQMLSPLSSGGSDSNLSSGHDRKLKSGFQFWSIFGRLPAKLGPKTLPSGSGLKNGAERT